MTLEHLDSMTNYQWPSLWTDRLEAHKRWYLNHTRDTDFRLFEKRATVKGRCRLPSFEKNPLMQGPTAVRSQSHLPWQVHTSSPLGNKLVRWICIWYLFEQQGQVDLFIPQEKRARKPFFVFEPDLLSTDVILHSDRSNSANLRNGINEIYYTNVLTTLITVTIVKYWASPFAQALWDIEARRSVKSDWKKGRSSFLTNHGDQ